MLTLINFVNRKQSDIRIACQQFYGLYFYRSNIVSHDLIFRNSFLVCSYGRPTVWLLRPGR